MIYNPIDIKCENSCQYLFPIMTKKELIVQFLPKYYITNNGKIEINVLLFALLLLFFFLTNLKDVELVKNVLLLRSLHEEETRLFEQHSCDQEIYCVILAVNIITRQIITQNKKYIYFHCNICHYVQFAKQCHNFPSFLVSQKRTHIVLL